MGQGAVLLLVGRSYTENNIVHSTLVELDRPGTCSYENLPKYCSYYIRETTVWITASQTVTLVGSTNLKSNSIKTVYFCNNKCVLLNDTLS